jgi:outer membrane protein TolC
VQGANAASRAALAAYEQTVLTAFVQVADVIQAVGNDQQSLAIQQRALALADANTHNTQFAYDNGAGTLLSVVDAQRQANRARLDLIDAQIRQQRNIAALYVATAADWRAIAK